MAAVGQVTFSGEVASRVHQTVLYVTERCTFRLGAAGLELTEIAPGVELERDVLAHLPFVPIVVGPSMMDPSIFQPQSMALRERLLDIRIEDRLSYDPTTNTVFMNYAGMRVRTHDDLRRIVNAVDDLLGPLNKRVYSIVNYDRFRPIPK